MLRPAERMTLDSEQLRCLTRKQGFLEGAKGGHRRRGFADSPICTRMIPFELRAFLA
jgi:hypothetical protein